MMVSKEEFIFRTYNEFFVPMPINFLHPNGVFFAIGLLFPSFVNPIYFKRKITTTFNVYFCPSHLRRHGLEK